MPSVADAKAISKSFEIGTALGVDTLHPRHISTMADQAVAVIIKVWAFILWCGGVQGPLAFLLVCSLPKPEGGLRPIGLCLGLLRL